VGRVERWARGPSKELLNRRFIVYLTTFELVASSSLGGTTHIHGTARSNGQCALLAPFKLGRSSSGSPLPNRTFPIPTIPHFHRTVVTSRCHVPSSCARVHRDADEWAEVRQ
jgi:hypothetical protein